MTHDTDLPTISEDGFYEHERHVLSCRVSIFGAAKVGKTKLVQRLMHNKYTETYVPTVEDYYEATEEYTGMTLTLKIIDTSGGEQFPAMRKLNMEKSNLVVLVYDVTNPTSVKEVERLYEICRRLTDVMVVIVGAKADFLPDTSPDEYKECIDRVDSFITETKDSRLQHSLCSARTGKNVGKILESALAFVISKLTSKLSATSKFWERFAHHHHGNHSGTHKHHCHQHGIWHMLKHLNPHLHEKESEKKVSLPIYMKERRSASSCN